ncbi:MAG: LytTR family transcriptional regulator, partial [Bacteroidales bacterium]|nr:LytTR family transcriptional regulator [Bacteroidales bacterium]
LRIVLPGKKIMTKQSFNGLMASLPDDQFIRVHKSWVVNLARVESVERNRIKIGDRLIPIGETYRDAFLRRIGLI